MTGDTPTIDDLIARWLPQLRAFVRVRMDDAFRARESGSDIVQSTCRELLEHGRAFEYRDEAQLRGFLFTADASERGTATARATTDTRKGPIASAPGATRAQLHSGLRTGARRLRGPSSRSTSA